MSIDNLFQNEENKKEGIEQKVGTMSKFFNGIKKTAFYFGSLTMATYFGGTFPLLMSAGMSAGEIIRIKKSKEKFSFKKLKPVAYAGMMCGLLVDTYIKYITGPIKTTSLYGKLAKSLSLIPLLFPFSFTAAASNHFTSNYTPASFYRELTSSPKKVIKDFYNEKIKGKYLSTINKVFKYIYPPLALNASFHIIKPEYLLPALSGFFRYKTHRTENKEKQIYQSNQNLNYAGA